MLKEKVKEVSFDELIAQKNIPISINRNAHIDRFKDEVDMFEMSFNRIVNYLYSLIYEKPDTSVHVYEYIEFKENKNNKLSLSNRDFMIEKVKKERENYLKETIKFVSYVLTEIEKIENLRSGFKFLVKSAFNYDLRKRSKFKSIEQLKADLQGLIEKLKTLSNEDFFDQFLNGGFNVSENFRKDIMYNIPENIDFIKSRVVYSLSGQKMKLEFNGFYLRNKNIHVNSSIYNNNAVFPILTLKDEEKGTSIDVDIIIENNEYKILNTEIMKSEKTGNEVVVPIFFETKEERKDYLNKELEKISALLN